MYCKKLVILLVLLSFVPIVSSDLTISNPVAGTAEKFKCRDGIWFGDCNDRGEICSRSGNLIDDGLVVLETNEKYLFFGKNCEDNKLSVGYKTIKLIGTGERLVTQFEGFNFNGEIELPCEKNYLGKISDDAGLYDDCNYCGNCGEENISEDIYGKDKVSQIPLGTSLVEGGMPERYFDSFLGNQKSGEISYHGELTIDKNSPRIETSLTSDKGNYRDNVYMEIEKNSVKYEIIFDNEIETLENLQLKFLENDIKIKGIEDHSIIASVNDRTVERISNGDIFGENDEWVWIINLLNHQIGIKNNVAWNIKMDKRDIKCINLPEGYASICLNGLNVKESEYDYYNINLDWGVDLNDVDPKLREILFAYEPVIKMESSKSKLFTLTSDYIDGLDLDLDLYRAYIRKMNEMGKDGRGIEFYYKDLNAPKERRAGDFKNGFNKKILKINNGELYLTISEEIPFEYIELILSPSTLEGDDLFTKWGIHDMNWQGLDVTTLFSLGYSPEEEINELQWGKLFDRIGLGTKTHNLRTKYGIVIYTPAGVSLGHGRYNEVALKIPPKQVKAIIDVNFKSDELKAMDIELGITTSKEIYNIGEKIELTGISIKEEDVDEKNYIVEFKDTSLIEKRQILEEERQIDNKNNELEQLEKEGKIAGAFVKKIDIGYNEFIINSNLHSEKRDIIKQHKKFKKDLSEQDFKMEDITGNVINSQSSENIEITKEYSKILRGVAIKTTSNTINKIKDLDYVKNVREEKKFELNLDKSREIIGADYVQNNIVDDNGLLITGKGIKVAVIDTGVDYTHPDLGGCSREEFLGEDCNKVVGGYDYHNDDGDPIDDMGHGTHVAGTIAGTGIASNGKYKGIAPDALIYAYKVGGTEGWLGETAILSSWDAMVDLDDDGIPFEDEEDYVDIVSMSFGGAGHPDDLFSKMVDDIVKGGIVAVVAAGNSGPYYQTIGSPGTSTYTITVGSSTKVENSKDSEGPDKISWFSSRGPTNKGTHKPDVLAPGGDVYANLDIDEDTFEVNMDDGIIAPFSTVVKEDSNLCYISIFGECRDDGHSVEDSQYIKSSGTSMATPMVSGAAALLLQKNPELNPLEIKQILKNTAVDLNYDVDTQGGGRIDIKKAIELEYIPPVGLLFGFPISLKGQRSIDIEGLVESKNLKKYSLYYQFGSNEKTLIYGSTILPPSNILANFDISGLSDESYEIILEVEDINGVKSIDSAILSLDHIYIESMDVNENGVATIYGGTENSNLARYELWIKEKSFDFFDKEFLDKWIKIYEGTNQISSGEIGSFDLNQFFDNDYIIELRAYDTSNNLLGKGLLSFKLEDNVEFISPKPYKYFSTGSNVEIRATIKNPNYHSLKLEWGIHPGRPEKKGEINFIESLPKVFENLKIADFDINLLQIKALTPLFLRLIFLSETGEELYSEENIFNIRRLIASQIVNKKDIDVEGRLIISIEKINEENNWESYESLVDENIIISENELFDLGTFFNQRDFSLGEEGDYWIVVRFITDKYLFEDRYGFRIKDL